MFKRESAGPSPSASPSHPSDAVRRTTIVARGSRLTGEISGSAEVRIEGEVEGKIAVEHTAVVGSEGVVKGEIRARNVTVAGRVVGNVRAGERVEVTASGNLEGDISAPRVIIAEGAFFKGKVEMKGGEAPGRPDKA